MWRGWFRGTSFGTNLGQNTIRKNKMTRKMTAQTSKPWRSYFLMWHSRREADHCADSAFPYLYYRRQHADCQARSALLCGIPKISSTDHKAACIFPDTDGSPDAFCRILLYSDAFVLHLIYRVSASFYGHSNAFSVLFGASKMHIFAFFELPVFSSKPRTRLMHLIIQFYYSQMPFVCQ